MPNLILPINEIKLERFPTTKDVSLKASNAADEYLLEWISENNLQSNATILIINDQFGALTCCLNNFSPYCWTDSFLSKTAIQINLKNNQIKPTPISIDQCEQCIPDNTKFDWIIIRIPKHNSLLEFQLKTIRQHIHSETKIISAGMTKDIHKSNLNLFESLIGLTKTSLAKKKARLIIPTLTHLIKKGELVEYLPDEEILNQCLRTYKSPQQGLKIIGLPGVFSRDSLDIGSRVLLQAMPITKANQKLIDLGCGTGVLGTYAAKQNSELEVTFTDESWLAIESAKKTFQENIKGSACFKVTNVLDGLENNHYDHILCNPPFHQQNVQTLAIANKMFKDSALKLNTAGELRVVANRHLKYRDGLSRYFSKVDIISKDPKFVVWLAKEPGK